MQKVVIDDRTYGVKYHHCHFGLGLQFDTFDIDDEIEKAFATALELKQVSKHRKYDYRYPHLEGYTRCEIYYGDILVAVGYSFCSDRDNFNKKIGRRIAFQRAKHNGGL